MKTALSSARSAADERAMTLVEVMMTMGVFSLVAVGLIQFQLLGLTQDRLVQSKLGASDQSRAALARMTSEIRSAKILRVGNGSPTGFTPIGYGTNLNDRVIELGPGGDGAVARHRPRRGGPDDDRGAG